MIKRINMNKYNMLSTSSKGTIKKNYMTDAIANGNIKEIERDITEDINIFFTLSKLCFLEYSLVIENGVVFYKRKEILVNLLYSIIENESILSFINNTWVELLREYLLEEKKKDYINKGCLECFSNIDIDDKIKFLAMFRSGVLSSNNFDNLYLEFIDGFISLDTGSFISKEIIKNQYQSESLKDKKEYLSFNLNVIRKINLTFNKLNMDRDLLVFLYKVLGKDEYRLFFAVLNNIITGSFIGNVETIMELVRIVLMKNNISTDSLFSSFVYIFCKCINNPELDVCRLFEEVQLLYGFKHKYKEYYFLLIENIYSVLIYTIYFNKYHLYEIIHAQFEKNTSSYLSNLSYLNVIKVEEEVYIESGITIKRRSPVVYIEDFILKKNEIIIFDVNTNIYSFVNLSSVKLEKKKNDLILLTLKEKMSIKYNKISMFFNKVLDGIKHFPKETKSFYNALKKSNAREMRKNMFTGIRRYILRIMAGVLFILLIFFLKQIDEVFPLLTMIKEWIYYIFSK
jgi:hypothetical protein